MPARSIRVRLPRRAEQGRLDWEESEPTISEAQDVKLQGFLAHRSLSRSEDETEIRAGEGIGRKGREGHPPRDAATFFSRGQDPHRAGGPAWRGQHRGALPS